MRLLLYSWAVFLSNEHYTLCTLALYLSLITRTVFTQFCGENCFWESGDFIFIVKEKRKGIFFVNRFFVDGKQIKTKETAARIVLEDDISSLEYSLFTPYENNYRNVFLFQFFFVTCAPQKR